MKGPRLFGATPEAVHSDPISGDLARQVSSGVCGCFLERGINPENHDVTGSDLSRDVAELRPDVRPHCGRR